MAIGLHNIYCPTRSGLTNREAVFPEPRDWARKGGPRPLTAAERVARFWAKIDRSGDCWVWRAGVTPDGYGLVHVTRRPDGRCLNDYAHRIAYRLTTGPIPHGLVVRHRCDNPPCCNPDHLILGTQAENVADAQRQGKYRGRKRQPRGGTANALSANHV